MEPQEIGLRSKVWATIGYLGPLCLWAAFKAEGDDFIRFHVKQALVLFILEVLCWILTAIPILGLLFRFIGKLVLGLYAVLGMVFALSGEYKHLPLIGGLSDRIVL